jgi:predicted nucleotidyltransferase
MKNVIDKLTDNEKKALSEIKSRVSSLFPICKFILFGSKARGDASIDSDVDLLIITERELLLAEKHIISEEIFRINLEYDVLYSFIAIDKEKWNSDLFNLYPIHINIERDGVLL